MSKDRLATTPPRAPRLHRFTARAYHEMARTGVLAPDARTELLNGRIYAMSPVGFRHALLLERLTDVFYTAYRPHARVRVQSPVALGPHSEPEPDVLLLRPDAPAERLPRPDDVLLVVKVSDATYAFDRDQKVPLYARAGVPEVWLVVPGTLTVEVYRGLDDGRYAKTEIVSGASFLAPSRLPDAPPLDVAALFDGL